MDDFVETKAFHQSNRYELAEMHSVHVPTEHGNVRRASQMPWHDTKYMYASAADSAAIRNKNYRVKSVYGSNADNWRNPPSRLPTSRSRTSQMDSGMTIYTHASAVLDNAKPGPDGTFHLLVLCVVVPQSRGRSAGDYVVQGDKSYGRSICRGLRSDMMYVAYDLVVRRV